jgi:hypothetical protein
MGGYPYPLLEEIGDRRTGEDAYEEERKASRSPTTRSATSASCAKASLQGLISPEGPNGGSSVTSPPEDADLHS